MVEALNTIDTGEHTAKRFAIDINNLNILKFKCISDFINIAPIKLFHRFNIKTEFLNDDFVLWNKNKHFLQGLK